MPGQRDQFGFNSTSSNATANFSLNQKHENYIYNLALGISDGAQNVSFDDSYFEFSYGLSAGGTAVQDQTYQHQEWLQEGRPPPSWSSIK